MIRSLTWVGLCWSCALTAIADPQPSQFTAADASQRLEQMLTPDKAGRKKAREELAAWAEKEPDQAKALFLQRMQESTEPEIRERCIQLLKPIAVLEYGLFGEGYIGISMGGALGIKLPDEENPCFGMTINSVSKGSPAEKFAIRPDDVIVSVNDFRWRDAESIQDPNAGLSAKIRGIGAGRKANFGIWREGKLSTIEVLLTRRPSHIDQLPVQIQANGVIKVDDNEMQKIVDEEKNSNVYFSEWLARQLQAQPPK
jgi:predicted metalloprotease with PDZ domain